MKLKVVGLLLIIALIAGYYFVMETTEINFMELKYIVTETKGPDSFDPVNADKTQNLSVMRMLFATPIEVDKSNSLQSKVLKTFKYDRNNSQIVFEVRDDQRYADGTAVTANDIALAIARMAYYRPQFPVIKYIEGVKEWAEKKDGLDVFPSGIKVDGSKVLITLTRKSANPLFRFCLELFSIIPEKCIDKKTAQMTCSLPPSSGYFSLKSQSSEEIVFEKRPNQNSVDSIPFETIRFQFMTLPEACKKKLASNEVISGVELDYLAANCKKELDSEQVHWMPSARFGVLRFNPNIFPFNNQKNRQLFAETAREFLRQKNNDLLIERGLFSKLLPGFVANEELVFSVDQATRDLFKGTKISLPQMDHSGLNIIFEAIVAAAKALEMNIHFFPEPTYEILLSNFLEGKVPVVPGASGFWAQDPVGDVSMWFTPNLHKTMTFAWADKSIYSKINELESEIDPNAVKLKMEVFNRYISEQALLAPVVHFRRLFISSKNVRTLNLPQAVTSPAPWQLMPGE